MPSEHEKEVADLKERLSRAENMARVLEFDEAMRVVSKEIRNPVFREETVSKVERVLADLHITEYSGNGPVATDKRNMLARSIVRAVFGG